MKSELEIELEQAAGEAEAVPELVLARIEDTLASIRNGEARKPARRKWYVASAAAALVVVVLSALAFAVPSFAEKLRSLFSANTVDIGLLNAQELGLVQHPHIKVTDKGYTVAINEVVADATRVVMALQLFGPDGKFNRDILSLHPSNRIELKDENGKVVGEMYDQGRTGDFYYMICIFKEPVQADELMVEGRIGELGGRKEPKIAGDWNFTFKVDMKEAKRQTRIVPVSGSYTSPGGLTLSLSRITRTVQGVRLELDTQLSDEALARSPGELWKDQQLSFHFEDMSGNEIHSVNTEKSPHKESLIAQSGVPGEQAGTMHWTYTFLYLPEGQPYRFVLDGYSIPERDGTSVSFAPAGLKEHPVSFPADAGDTIVLKNFYMADQPGAKEGEKEAALGITGELVNSYSHDQWLLQDESGNTYLLSGRGSYGTVAKGWKDGVLILSGGNPQEPLFEFRTPDITAIPDRLTLIRSVIDKRYTNVDWTERLEDR